MILHPCALQRNLREECPLLLNSVTVAQNEHTFGQGV